MSVVHPVGCRPGGGARKWCAAPQSRGPSSAGHSPVCHAGETGVVGIPNRESGTLRFVGDWWARLGRGVGRPAGALTWGTHRGCEIVSSVGAHRVGRKWKRPWDLVEPLLPIPRSRRFQACAANITEVSFTVGERRGPRANGRGRWDSPRGWHPGSLPGGSTSWGYSAGARSASPWPVLRPPTHRAVPQASPELAEALQLHLAHSPCWDVYIDGFWYPRPSSAESIMGEAGTIRVAVAWCLWPLMLLSLRE